jgi:phosphate transport system permease protein
MTKKTVPSRFGDLIFGGVARLSAAATLALLFGVLAALVIAAWPSIEAFGINFLTSAKWDFQKKEFGAWAAIVGTLVSALVAVLIAVPISFGIALFLTELSPKWLRQPLTVAVELLAAIPSIVYGMWGVLVFAPIFGKYFLVPMQHLFAGVPVLGALFEGSSAQYGRGLLSSGVILSIMIIPFITSVMRDVFSVVPSLLKEAAYGLGSTTWEVIWKVVLPYTKVGVVGGIILGLGRALGETMAVTFVIGSATNYKGLSFVEPATSLTAMLASNFGSADDPLQRAALIELGLILFLITGVVLVCSKLLLLRLNKQEGK